jgi:hypothetical protein
MKLEQWTGYIILIIIIIIIIIISQFCPKAVTYSVL